MTESRIQCVQVWDGSGVADTTVSTTGLDVGLYCKPFGGEKEGGDVYYLSSCSSGRITRLVLADVRGHGEGVASLSGSLRRLVQRYIDHIDHGTLVQSINRAFVRVGDAGTFATGLIATFFVPTSEGNYWGRRASVGLWRATNISNRVRSFRNSSGG